MEMISQMKEMALQTEKYEKGIDYTIETNTTENENKSIVFIDKSTGMKIQKKHWKLYEREMFYVKEQIEIPNQIKKICSISLSDYFSKYHKFCCYSTSIGEEQDEDYLCKQYNVNIIKLPDRFAIRKIISQRKRSKEWNGIKMAVLQEITKEQEKGRPILIIVNTIDEVKQFQQIIGECQIVIGNDIANKIETIGKSKQISIGTIESLRHYQIPLDDQSRSSGGLYIIIPFKLKTKRMIEYACNLCGKCFEKGTVSLYTDENDTYSHSIPIHIKQSITTRLQSLFSNYLNDNYSWIYHYTSMEKIGEEYPFEITPEEFFEYSKWTIMKRIFTEDQMRQYVVLLKNIILTSWSIFYSNVYNNPIKYSNEEMCLNEYSNYIQTLEKYIPQYPPMIDKTSVHIQNVFWNENDMENTKESKTICGITFVDSLRILPINLSSEILNEYQIQKEHSLFSLLIQKETALSIIRNIITELQSIKSIPLHTSMNSYGQQDGYKSHITHLLPRKLLIEYHQNPSHDPLDIQFETWNVFRYNAVSNDCFQKPKPSKQISFLSKSNNDIFNNFIRFCLKEYKIITKQTDFDSTLFTKDEKQILVSMHSLLLSIQEQLYEDWEFVTERDLNQRRQQLKTEWKLNKSKLKKIQIEREMKCCPLIDTIQNIEDEMIIIDILLEGIGKIQELVLRVVRSKISLDHFKGIMLLMGFGFINESNLKLIKTIIKKKQKHSEDD